MTNNAKQHIFFVDDEPKVREVVSETIEQLGVKVAVLPVQPIASKN